MRLKPRIRRCKFFGVRAWVCEAELEDGETYTPKEYGIGVDPASAYACWLRREGAPGLSRWRQLIAA